jgi:uncharacterized membrane protein
VQRVFAQATRQVARPVTLLALLALAAAWIAINLAMPRARAFDPPPFDHLQLALSGIAMVLTCMILSTQQREDLLASHRAHLTLQLAMSVEQKCAKTIALLEEMRRDLPMLADRHDTQAETLSRPTDAETVIDKLVAEPPSRAKPR